MKKRNILGRRLIPARLRMRLLNALTIAFIFTCLIQGISIIINGFDIETLLDTFFLFFILGLVITLCEVFIFQRLFHRKRLLWKALLQTVFYILLFSVITLVRAITSSQLYMKYNPETLEEISYDQLRYFAENPVSYLRYNKLELLAGLFSLFFIILLINIISQISRKIGPTRLFSFLTGRYRRPRKEQRIFMFLDVKSSTTLAEDMGDETYHEMLNDYFYQLAEPILQTEGEIYQYVGDEVVISWRLTNGLPRANCVRCYYLAKEAIEAKAGRFQKRYGVVPTFKAGLHYGDVIASEVGDIKSEIVFHGDVLNTTSRIQSLCNELGAEVLISEELWELIPDNSEFHCKNLGAHVLRGKHEPVNLCAIEQSKKARRKRFW